MPAVLPAGRNPGLHRDSHLYALRYLVAEAYRRRITRQLNHRRVDAQPAPRAALVYQAAIYAAHQLLYR
jgi:hypothetical protein